MSPDRRVSAELPAPETRAEHRRQGLVAVCGAEETPETVRMTKEFAERFETLGARVSHPVYPGMSMREPASGLRTETSCLGKVHFRSGSGAAGIAFRKANVQ